MMIDEFVEKIENASEMMFEIRGVGYTICEEDKGFSIAQWGKPETEARYDDAKSLVDSYIVDGKPIGTQTADINITEYTGYY